MMARMTLREAIKRYSCKLVTAATGAIEKKGKEGKVRVVFDALSDVLVNQQIRSMDQVRCAAAGDTKGLMTFLRRT